MLTTTDRYLSAREWRTRKNWNSLRGRRVELIEMEVSNRLLRKYNGDTLLVSVTNNNNNDNDNDNDNNNDNENK